jgi:hypothetical protein
MTADVPAQDWLVGLRLLDARGRSVAQEERRLVSAWYPGATVPAGTPALVIGRLTVPWGTVPGQYRPQAVVYAADMSGTVLPVISGGDQFGGLTLEPVTVKASTGASLAAPIAHSVGSNLGGRFVLAGYEGGEGKFQQGARVPLTTLWQAGAPDGRAYQVFWQLEAPGGIVAEGAAEPLDGGYPTSAWQPGEWVRNLSTLHIPGNVLPGDYRVLVGLRDADKKRLPVTGTLLPAGDAVALGTIRVVARFRSYTIPAISHPLPAGVRLGDGVQLLGYDLGTTTARPGQAVSLTLYWQCLAPMSTNYTVFVHLVDEANQIRGQVDVEPGAVPTSGWAIGEVVVDTYQPPLKPDAPAGTYTIYVGLYDPATWARLPATDAAGQFLGDRMPVARFTVSPQ